MVGLVLVAQPADDLDGLVHRGRIHHDRLEPALEGAVLLDVLAKLVQRGRSDALKLAAGESGLQHVGGVDGSLRAARADDRVQLVDEDDGVLGLADLVHHRLEALLELSAILGARDDSGEIQRDDALVLERLGNLVLHDPLGQPLGDGGLAHARLADQDRVVLLAPREDLDDAVDLGLAPDDRIQLPFPGEHREVAAELIQRGRFDLALALRLRHGGRPAEQLERLLADLLPVHAELEQHARGDPFALADQSQEEVLGADVVVAELARLVDAQFQYPLRARRERNLPDRERSARRGDHALDRLAYRVEIQSQIVQHGGSDSLPLANDAEEQVLGADVVVLEPRGFLPREIHHLPHAFRELVMHDSEPPPRSANYS